MTQEKTTLLPGDVLLNVPHMKAQDGAYYHYSDVCVAMKQFARQEAEKARQEERQHRDGEIRLIGNGIEAREREHRRELIETIRRHRDEIRKEAEAARQEERERHDGIVKMSKEYHAELLEDGFSLRAEALQEELLSAGYEVNTKEESNG